LLKSFKLSTRVSLFPYLFSLLNAFDFYGCVEKKENAKGSWVAVIVRRPNVQGCERSDLDSELSTFAQPRLIKD